MAKAKHSPGSAAQRREQARREQRSKGNANTSYSSRSPRAPKKQKNTGLIIGLVSIALVFVIALFWILSLNQPKADTTTATPNVFNSFTKVDPNLLATVGGGSASESVQSLVKGVKSAPIAKGPTGKPQVFYMGADYCPYCGSQRYALIVALSKFGSFDKPLKANISGESSVPTYSFHESKFTSQYIDFVPVEVRDNQGKELEKLTSDQEALVQKYDAPPYTTEQGAGAFPFTSIGNQYIISGAMFSPELLIGKSHEQISTEMKDSSTDISRGMLGSANYLTAAICKITNNQPGNVCNTDTVKELQQKLPQPTAYNKNADSALALATRRQD